MQHQASTDVASQASNAGVREWATYFGGDNADEGRCAAYDPQAETLIITGHTASQQTTFPLLDIPGTADYFDGTYNGGDGDGFLGELILDCNACLQYKMQDEALTKATETGALRVWPNPTTGYLMIEQDEAQALTATVYTVADRQVGFTPSLTTNELATCQCFPALPRGA